MSKNNLLVIGDVHGKVSEYLKILQFCGDHNSIQVGDFGFRDEHEWHLKNIDSTKHQINFGNHDDYSFIGRPHSLGDWSFNPFNGVMTVRGADSIDKKYRTEGISWWANEELTYSEMQRAIDEYSINKPRIMITHDCPQKIRELWFNIENKIITSNGLQAMFEYHQPKIWIFGHHHKSKIDVINGTKFICLNELESIIV